MLYDFRLMAWISLGLTSGTLVICGVPIFVLLVSMINFTISELTLLRGYD
jgi:hypothetical protein